MDAEVRHQLGATFGAAADVYDRARPGYAGAALDWALPDGARQVLDLAAGTGKLTTMLVDRGLDVIAVEPSPPMLARLRRLLPSTDARNATAEATGLPGGSVDAIVIGSALHWFDRPTADVEMARVLRPGGIVASFSNHRDTDVAWVRALDEVLEASTSGQARLRHESRMSRLDPAHFGPADRRAFPYSQRLNAERLAELVSSRSYVLAMEPARREALMAEVRELARTHPDLRARDEFELPYRTVVSRSVQTLRS